MATTVDQAAAEIIEKIVRSTKDRVPDTFVREFYAWAGAEDLRERGAEQLAEAVVAHFCHVPMAGRRAIARPSASTIAALTVIPNASAIIPEGYVPVLSLSAPRTYGPANPPSSPRVL